MEKNYQGELGDIIRASSGAASSNAVIEPPSPHPDWQFPINYSCHFEHPPDHFGQPLASHTHIRPVPYNNTRDSIHGIDTSIPGLFSNSSIDTIKTNFKEAGKHTVLEHRTVYDREMKKPSNLFSRMIQISPNAKLSVSPSRPQMNSLKTGGPVLVSNDHINSPNTSKGFLVESPGLQISAPRNTGIKRRKNQTKKVVCIPAPGPVNSRQTGEIVPSDLWAWRKYGQKPIKGSPYPRGYYRCSSSKGCSARKQVERSRMDPKMLVITYTSEHNHPWPTQRNALAGSTRSHLSKNNSSAKSSSNPQSEKTTDLKDQTNTENEPSSLVNVRVTPGPIVKEEKDQDFGKNQFEMDDVEFNETFTHNYELPDSNHSEDLFAELGEIETDSLDHVFGRGLSGDDGQENKALDPFSFYDWAGNSSGDNTTSYGVSKQCT